MKTEEDFKNAQPFIPFWAPALSGQLPVAWGAFTVPAQTLLVALALGFLGAASESSPCLPLGA